MASDTPSPLPIYDFGGQGAPVHLAVANGFPPQTYRPLLEPLSGRYHVINTLPRALWPSPPPPETLRSWRDMAADILTSLHQRDLRDVIAIGHSMGGVASVMAAIAEPERFKALILLDPTFVPPSLLAVVWAMRAIGRGDRFPLAVGALKRRARFASADEAFEYWKTRPLFAKWPVATVRLYADSLTRPSADGGVELAWTPAWEARYYRTFFLGWRAEARKLRGLLPTLVIQGAQTDTFTDPARRIMQRLVPGATYARIEGHGHLFPQSAPDQTREVIEPWLNQL